MDTGTSPCLQLCLLCLARPWTQVRLHVYSFAFCASQVHGHRYVSTSTALPSVPRKSMDTGTSPRLQLCLLCLARPWTQVRLHVKRLRSPLAWSSWNSRDLKFVVKCPEISRFVPKITKICQNKNIQPGGIMADTTYAHPGQFVVFSELIYNLSLSRVQDMLF